MVLPSIPLKFYLVAAAAIALVVSTALYIDGVRDRAYQAGEDAQAERVRKLVAERDEANRRLETALQNDLNRVMEALDKSIAAMDARTDKRIETVREIITANPQLDECRIPPEIIDQKNALREEGVL